MEPAPKLTSITIQPITASSKYKHDIFLYIVFKSIPILSPEV